MQEQHVLRAQKKAAPLKLRLSPFGKNLLTAAVNAGRESLSNTVEVAVLGYCQQHRIFVADYQRQTKRPVVANQKRVAV